ncbi:uncharacterized protein AMSG_06819 [Thecamonas trahens ATCC 50062]|uniref:Uncharacterized protein n=1 Tax=Thecamonas trahens ATCC 50062 TaxID=461836 RepID=A0A0L0DDN7_THETB|nr:hypothetical protein AMSG_06819 [Thecamonas trahens ATCC 50062]KNC50335.1 hypothetical protein AMSG_06819 [Thecamonas trahens ATCC 50062]|eukprot:XP_013756881.1 hypothetical protein AMSG_06819 [Thecamonas trahens ATCC 50062]
MLASVSVAVALPGVDARGTGWTRLPPLVHPRLLHASVAVAVGPAELEAAGHVMGKAAVRRMGDGAHLGSLPDLEVLDSIECLVNDGKAWSVLPQLKLPRPMYGLAVARWNKTAVLAAGGSGETGGSATGTRDVWLIDFARGTVEPAPPLPFAIFGVQMTAGGDGDAGGVWLAGGWRNYNLCAQQLLRLNATAAAWQVFPHARYAHCFGGMGVHGKEVGKDTVFVFGGSADNAPALNTLEQFAASSSGWTVLQPLVYARDMMAAAQVGGALYAIGGRDPEMAFLDSVEVYHLDSGWAVDAALTLPVPLAGASAATSGRLVVVSGGVSAFNATHASGGAFRLDVA